MEAAYIGGAQLIDGGNAGGGQDLLQEVAGPQAPHQTGELALGGRSPHIPVHGAQHRGVGGARAPRCTVDVVELWGWGGGGAEKDISLRMVVWSGCAIITNRSFIQTFLYLTSEICAPLTAAPQGSLKNHKLTRARSQTDTAERHAGFLLDNHSRKPRAAARRDVPPLCRLLSRGSRVTTPQEPRHRLPRPQGECARTAAAEMRCLCFY